MLHGPLARALQLGDLWKAERARKTACSQKPESYFESWCFSNLPPALAPGPSSSPWTPLSRTPQDPRRDLGRDRAGPPAPASLPCSNHSERRNPRLETRPPYPGTSPVRAGPSRPGRVAPAMSGSSRFRPDFSLPLLLLLLHCEGAEGGGGLNGPKPLSRKRYVHVTKSSRTVRVSMSVIWLMAHLRFSVRTFHTVQSASARCTWVSESTGGSEFLSQSRKREKTCGFQVRTVHQVQLTGNA